MAERNLCIGDIVLVREDNPDENWLGEIKKLGTYFSQVLDLDPGSRCKGNLFFRKNDRLEHTDRVC
jgi:hypothetical protein